MINANSWKGGKKKMRKRIGNTYLGVLRKTKDKNE